MKSATLRLARLFCVPVVLIGGLAGSALGQTAPFTLKISPVAEKVKVGRDVFINITLTNTSDHPLDLSTYVVGSTDMSYNYDVRMQDGSPAPKRDMNFPYPGSFSGVTLAPGEKTSGENFISWLVDFSKPGKYTIQISRAISGKPSDGVVKSNTITMEVIP